MERLYKGFQLTNLLNQVVLLPSLSSLGVLGVLGGSLKKIDFDKVLELSLNHIFSGIKDN
ncbi:MAG: hypothetical protein NWQ28_10815 [Nodularia sp. (in: cyanobacteria)]|nr:hypothetical protein [Nodularia sp. (in: cyanobacteria)]